MKRPVEGPPIRIGGYFRGSAGTHMVGMVGGMIWCLGQSYSMIASGQAGAAIWFQYGRGQTLVPRFGAFSYGKSSGALGRIETPEPNDVHPV